MLGIPHLGFFHSSLQWNHQFCSHDCLLPILSWILHWGFSNKLSFVLNDKEFAVKNRWTRRWETWVQVLPLSCFNLWIPQTLWAWISWEKWQRVVRIKWFNWNTNALQIVKCCTLALHIKSCCVSASSFCLFIFLLFISGTFTDECYARGWYWHEEGKIHTLQKPPGTAA